MKAKPRGRGEAGSSKGGLLEHSGVTRNHNKHLPEVMSVPKVLDVWQKFVTGGMLCSFARFCEPWR